MVKAIKLNFKISGTKLTIPFKSICSIINKPFIGDIIVEYHPKSKVLEYIDFEKSIKELTSGKTTAEKLANDVFKEVKKSINPNYLKVSVDVKKSKAHEPTIVWVET